MTVDLTMDDGKSEAVAVTEDPPPEEVGSRCKLLGGLLASLFSCHINADTVVGALQGWKGTCILEWCDEDVRAWLNYKRWEAYFPEPVPDGEMLAIRTQNRFKRDIKDDGVAQDIFDAITVNLKLSRKKLLFDKDVLETIIEERSKYRPNVTIPLVNLP